MEQSAESLGQPSRQGAVRTNARELPVSSRHRVIARRVAGFESVVDGLNTFVWRLNDGQRAIRTDLNREVGARRVRFESTWRYYDGFRNRLSGCSCCQRSVHKSCG